MEKEAHVYPIDTVETLQTLGNPIRKSVVHALASKPTVLKFSELMEVSGLDPNSDTGQFWYHLSELIKRGIVIRDQEHYRLSQFGFKLSKILDIVERECSFLFEERKERGEPRMEDDFQIRKYRDSDFEQLAKLVKEFYDYYWKELWGKEEVSLEYARHIVGTDMLVPITYVYVAEDLRKKKAVGFVTYDLLHGGAFWLNYLWVEKEYLSTRLREALLERVEEDVLKAGEDQYCVHISVGDKLCGEFFIRYGFDTLNELEMTKYLKEAPKRKYSAENVEFMGYKFKNVILWSDLSTKK
jgi:hypothetical protein